jgi:hypothetical protein
LAEYRDFVREPVSCLLDFFDYNEIFAAAENTAWEIDALFKGARLLLLVC